MTERIANELQGDLLTTREAAALLPGVSTQTLLRWARTGRVPSVQYIANGRRLFRRSDLEEAFPEVFQDRGDGDATSQDVPLFRVR